MPPKGKILARGEKKENKSGKRINRGKGDKKVKLGGESNSR